MSPRRLYVFFLTFMLMIASASLILSASGACVIREEYMYLLAVGSSDGSYSGVATSLRVSLIPGDGSVYLSIDPLSEIDMQSSLKVASLVAGFVSGADFSSYSVLVRIQSDTPIVGGPSAGAALTTALIALILNVSLSNSVVVTGMIMPDTLVGPVGGIPEKLEAAASIGAEVMVIPAGQRISTSLNSGARVDVVRRGQELGIRVVEASTIYDVLKYFGISVELPVVSNPSLNEEVMNAFKAIAENYIHEYSGLFSNVSADVNTFNKELARAWVLDDVNEFLSRSSSEAVRGEDAYRAGNFYAAASDYFSALVYVWAAKLLVSRVAYGVGWSNVIEWVSREVANASRYFNDLISVTNVDSLDVSRLSVLVEMASRAYESNSTLNQLRALQRVDVNAFYQAAYTYMRAKSVYGWGSIYNVLKPGELSVSLGSLEFGTQALLSFSRASVMYLQSLLGSSVYVTNLVSYLDSAESLLTRGGLNNILMSLGLALKASSYASIETHLNFESNTSLLTSRLIEAAHGYIGLAKDLGVEPVVSLVYLERGASLLGIDSESAAYFIDQAILNSIWFLMLAKVRTPVGISTTTPAATTTPAGTLTGEAKGGVPDMVYVLAVVAVSAVSGALLGYLSGSRRGARVSSV